MLLVVCAGLLWRMVSLPAFYSKYGGDALWALLIFLGVRFLFVRGTTGRVALWSFCFCCAVEFSQLYHAPWIESARNTRFGALVLGATFNWPDFVAYGFGIILGCLAEIVSSRRA